MKEKFHKNEKVREKLNDPKLLAHYEKMFQSIQDFYDTPNPEPIWLPLKFNSKPTKDIYTNPEGYIEEAMHWHADHVDELMKTEGFGLLTIEK